MKDAVFQTKKPSICQRKLPLRRTLDRCFREVQGKAVPRRSRLLLGVGLCEQCIYKRSHQRVHRRKTRGIVEDLWLLLLIFFLKPGIALILTLFYFHLNRQTFKKIKKNGPHDCQQNPVLPTSTGNSDTSHSTVPGVLGSLQPA